jgi:hypothetical protein
MLDNRTLADFIQRFYGYGNYRARYWFVGMEEGGGNTLEEISRRVEAWDERGRKELEDVADFHRAIGINHLFDNRPKLQPTWNKLIRIILSADGQPCNTDTIRTYQKNRLGTLDGDTCLLELLPLPSPNTSAWLYRENSTLPYLIDRAAYRAQVSDLRVAHLQDRLSHHHPEAVVFYGLHYQAYWEQIAGVQTWARSPEGIWYGSRDQTLVIVAMHPAAKGVSNEYFHEIGRLIGSLGTGLRIPPRI